MPIDVQMPDGTIISGVPDNITQADLLARYKAYAPPTPSAPSPENITGAVPDELGRYDVAKQPTSGARKPEDVGFLERNIAAAKRGVESLEDVGGGLGLAGTAITGTNAETAAKMREIKREQAKPQETPGLSAADIERIYKEKGLGAAIGQVPSYISESILASAPQIAVPLAAGAAAGAMSGPFAPVVAPLVGIGTYGIQQFGNFLTRQAVEKNDPRELDLTKAALTAGATAPLGYFADRFTAGLGGIATKKAGAEILKELSARQVAAKVGKRAAGGATVGIIAEAPLEVLEQAAERYQAGLELTGDDANREYKEAFFGAAAAGAGIGGVSRGIQAYQTPTKPGVPPEVPPSGVTPPEVPPEAPPMTAPPSISQDTQAMIDEFQGTTPPPVAPVSPVPPIEPPPTPPAPTEVTPEPLSDIWGSIQNRDRSTPASIAQMTKIANEPDYSRVSMSRDYGTGAPIVAGSEIDPTRLGRTDTVTGADGKKVPIQYGVIEAGEVIPSHNADGTKNAAYVDESVPAFRAITNGRVAGLQAAYSQGTATDYRNALINDDLHGIDKGVIEGMQNPMLVRVMPMDQVNKNTGDVSNTGAGLSFNIVEQAKNDTNRVDLATVSFTDSGDVSQQTIKDFIKAMPTTEQGNLMDKQGNPTKQAVERVDAAIFQQAYGNDKLTELAFQAQDEEARNIVRALNMAASKAIRLGEAGDYDVRPLVNEAVEMAINARRNNLSLSDAAKQVDMTTNPMANQIVQMFADNPRSAKAIGENLSNLFDNAYNEGNKEGADMFGEVPKRPVDQLIKESFAKKTEPDLFEAEKATRPTENQEEPAQFKSKKSMEEIAKDIDGMTKGSEIAQYLVDTAPNAAAKAIAERTLFNIKAIEDSGVPVVVEVLQGSKRKSWFGSSALVDGGTKKIKYFKVEYNGLNAKGQAETFPGSKDDLANIGMKVSRTPTGTRYSTLLHEMLHVISQVQLDALIKRNYKGPDKIIYNELRSIYNAVKDQIEQDRKNLPREQWHPLIDQVGSSYKGSILKDIHELFVRTLSEKDVQSYLSGVKMGKKTALTKLMEIFRKVIGLNPDYQSALDRMMIVSEQIFAQTPADMKRLAQTEGFDFPTMKEEQVTVESIIADGIKRYANGLVKNGALVNDGYGGYTILGPSTMGGRADAALTKIIDGIEKRLKAAGVSTERNADGSKDLDDIIYQKVLPQGRNFAIEQETKKGKEKRSTLRAEEEPTLKTDTPQFKKWFGNSKITNEDGSPMVLYHATAKDLSILKPGGFDVKMSGPAIWMSDRSDIQPAAHNIGSTTQEFREGANVMPLYAKIENPLVLDDDTMLDWARKSFANGSKEFPELISPDFADAIKAEGYDGIIYATTDINKKAYNEIIAFESNQLKSAISNTGEFNPEDARIQYEEVAEEPSKEKPPTEARNYLGKPVKPTWEFPEDSFIRVPGVADVSVNNLIYKFQDKQIDTKRAQEAISKAAGQITDDINVYEKEQLFHGKVATAIREYLLNELLPAIKKLKALNLKPQEMQDYLLARHAEERNNKMNELNKLDPRTGKERTTPWELQDRASGMSTADAQAFLKNLDPAKKQSLETVAKMFDDMVTGTQKILVDSGADSQDTIDAWNETYKHYVPLFRIEENFVNGGMGATGLSKGFNVSGNFSKRAMGSEKEVQDIIANLIKQRERALIRAEKLTVTKALYGLFLMNPNPDVALPVNPDAIKSKEALIAELEGLGYDNPEEIANNLMEEPKSRYISKEKRIIDKNTGLPTTDTPESVKLKVNNLDRFGDNVLTLRIDGKNRYIFFNQKNPDALRMANSLKSLDVENLGTLTSMVSKATRWFASVNTQYNPIFAAVNLIRDVGGAQFNLTTTPLAGKQAQVTAGIFPAMKGIFKILRAERKGEVGGDSYMEKAFREFRKEGGQTGYRDSLARRENEQSIVDEQLKKITAGGNTKKAFKAVFGALSDFNDTLENAIRLSAYLQASKPKDEGGLGLSKQQAAIIAKNLTVNFDKKGQLSANINALYAFFNASIQGTARLAQTLKGPKGKAIMGGGVLLGAMQSILLAAAGFKEDEPPEFVKERNFIIPTPDGNYLTIPYPLGLHILPSVGRLTTEFVLSGGKNPTKKVGNLIGVFADGLSPVGSAGPLQSIAPTVLDPLAALSENKDAFGRPIYKKDQATNPTPGYMRSRESSSEINKQISYFLNMASGGGKYSKGLLSPTADELDYVVGQVTGGVGRELMKAGQTIKAASTGEDLPAYRVPLAGRFYGETQSNAAESQRFYTNVTKMADHENEIKGRIKNKEPVGQYMKDHPEAKLWQTANTVENQINQLNKQKKEFIERGLPKDRIKRIENQKAVIMKRFNDQLAKFEE
jgi:hypothetical protein